MSPASYLTEGFMFAQMIKQCPGGRILECQAPSGGAERPTWWLILRSQRAHRAAPGAPELFYRCCPTCSPPEGKLL